MDIVSAAGLVLINILIVLIQGGSLLSSFAVISLALCAIAGSLKCNDMAGDINKGIDNNFFSILIPAYMEGDVLLENVEAIARQNYPRHRIKVSVVADRLAPALIAVLREKHIVVYDVAFEESTKSKALRYFLEHDSPGAEEYVVILDADNVCHPDFLKEINKEINYGFRVIQGKRIAKNQDTVIARLDAISEYNGNFLSRKSSLFLNVSGTLIGSGFAMQYELFKKHILALSGDIMGGFDKELQNNLVLSGDSTARIKYCEEAICYDEKTGRRSPFVMQRARWIAAYLQYVPKAARLFRRAVFSLDRNSFFMGIYGMTPPYSWICMLNFLLLMFSVIFRHTLIHPGFYLTIYAMLWAIPLLALYDGKADKKVRTTYIFFAPLFLLISFQSLFKLKFARKNFLHTPHGKP